jgi:pimeloyl-ACP methyl ester carboxylesterase
MTFASRFRSIVMTVALAACVLAAPGAGRAAEALPRETFDHPGRLVGLPDHRKLNFRCMGRGAPTVILETGFGASSIAWGRVQPSIASVTQVCSYDRAGYGFSDPGPLPRDGAAIALDLDRGLKAAGIGGPYVLVGHSAGGLYIRLMAARRRHDVVGLVFVDSSIEHQAANVEGILRRPTRCLEVTLAKPALETAAERAECTRLAGGDPAHPTGLKPGAWRTQISELETLFTTTSEQVDRTGNLLKDVPAIVLTAGKADGQAAGADDPAAVEWQGLHRQLAARFIQGDQRVVRSSHLMMNDRPEVVAGAVIELVQAARKH